MMTGQRRPLDFGELDEFTPRSKPATPAAVERKAVDQAAAFPSRERPDDFADEHQGPGRHAHALPPARKKRAIPARRVLGNPHGRLRGKGRSRGLIHSHERAGELCPQDRRRTPLKQSILLDIAALLIPTLAELDEMALRIPWHDLILSEPLAPLPFQIVHIPRRRGRPGLVIDFGVKRSFP